MIFDSIENAEMYYCLGERIKMGLEYLKSTDFDSLPEGKVEIDGDNVFALLQKYETKNSEVAKWEAHRKYIDIQYMADGAENIGFILADYLEILEEYDEKKDIEFLEGLGDYVQVNKGEFAIFHPDDAHMPGLKIRDNEAVYKVVVKIKID